MNPKGNDMRVNASVSIIPHPYAGIIRIRCLKEATLCEACSLAALLCGFKPPSNLLLSMGIISAFLSASRLYREARHPLSCKRAKIRLKRKNGFSFMDLTALCICTGSQYHIPTPGVGTTYARPDL